MNKTVTLLQSIQQWLVNICNNVYTNIFNIKTNIINAPISNLMININI